MEIFEAFWCALVKFFNFIIENVFDLIISSIAWVVALLPSVPFEPEPLDWGEFGNSIGYFLPISDAIVHFSLMLILMIIWLGVQHILRVSKMIR